jgi:hypothetical protein
MQLLILPAVRRYVAEDAQLVDVGVVLRIDSFQLRMQGGIAGARQTCVTLFDLDVRVALVEVG